MIHSLYLVFDLAILALSTRECMQLLGMRCRDGLAEKGVARALLASAQIVLLSLLLGYAGLYRIETMTVGLVLIFAAARLLRASVWSPVRPGNKGEGSEAAGFLSFECRVGLGFVVCTSLVLLATALFAFPLNYDSQSYRLSRIGYWLQEGTIAHYPSGDDRQNYAGFNGDLLMMWVIAHFPHGFSLSNVVQPLAGVVLLLSVWMFGGILQLGPASRMVAVVSMFSVPSFVAHFTTSQNDLIVACFIFAGLTFFTRSVRDGSLSDMVLAGVGIALACGTKGTVFYWGPGLVVYALVLFLLYRPAIGWLFRGGVIALSLLCLLGAPRYLENGLQWGNCFGSPEHYEMMHGERTFSADKLTLNLASLAVQNVAPVSNSFLYSKPLQKVAEGMAELIPETESGDTVISGKRSVYLERVVNFRGKRSASDFSSLGVFMTLVAGVGWMLCFRFRGGGHAFSRASGIVLGTLLFSVLLYIVLFAAMFKYQPYTSRYFLMLAPVGALSAGLIADRLGRVGSKFFIALSVLVASTVAGETYFSAGNSGFENVLASSNYRTRMVFNAQANAIAEDLPAGGRLAYSFGRGISITAGMFRNKNGVSAYYVPAEQIDAAGSVRTFLEKEGFDGLILRTDHDLDAQGTYRRAYAHEGKWGGRESFVLYKVAGDESENAFVTDFSYAEDSVSEIYEWRVENAGAGALSIKIRNANDGPLYLSVYRGELQKDVMVPQAEDLSVYLGRSDVERIAVRVMGAQVNHSIELNGATPLISPF